jgi:amino acid transporter
VDDTATPAVPVAPVEADPDAVRLRELGYEQELRRVLRGFDNATIGFATISPVVGLYAVVLVGISVAGPAWVWVLPVALAGQCLLLAVYAELASEFPISNGIYQWSRRLLGPTYGWLSGWIALCAYAVANTTIAYLGAPWALALLGIEPTSEAIVLTAIVLVLVCSLANARGVRVVKHAVALGVATEVVVSIGVGVALLLAFRNQDGSVLGDTLDAEAGAGGSVGAAFLAALAVGGWVFIGFDACVGASEETRNAARQVPRAVWFALLSVAAVVILDAVAVTLAHPNLGDVVDGTDENPVTTAVVSAFGSWSSKPFEGAVLVAFLACGTAAQGLTARSVYSISRDGVLPGSAFLRRVDRLGVPIGSLVTITAIACLGLLLGLQATAIGSVIAFGTAAIYLSFLLVALAALIARVRGSWVPRGTVRLGRLGLVLNVLAVAWLAFETVNIAWPRASLAPAGAPWYQIWAAPLVLGAIGTIGVAYVLVAKPQRHFGGGASESTGSAG